MSKSRLFIAMTCIILTALLIILIIINKFVIISIKNESISKEKWIEDIKYLQLNLPQKHTNLFFNESEEQFNSAIKKLQNNVYNLNSDQIQIELMKIISFVSPYIMRYKKSFIFFVSLNIIGWIISII